MYQWWDIVSPGTINLGTRGPRKFAQGPIVSGRPVIPPNLLYSCTIAKKKWPMRAPQNGQLYLIRCGVKMVTDVQSEITSRWALVSFWLKQKYPFNPILFFTASESPRTTLFFLSQNLFSFCRSGILRHYFTRLWAKEKKMFLFSNVKVVPVGPFPYKIIGSF